MNYRHIIFSFLILFLLSACKEEELPVDMQLSVQPHLLQVGPSVISFGPNSGLVQRVEIRAQNTDWTIIGLPDWITAQPTSGSGNAMVTLTAQENNSVTQARSATFYVSSSHEDFKFQRELKVSQLVAQPYLRTSNIKELSFLPIGSIQSIEISSNVDWHVEFAPSWVTCSPKTGVAGKTTLGIKPDDNKSTTQRSGSITIKAVYGNSVSIDVTQEGITFSLSDQKLELPNTTSSRTVTVKTNYYWVATTAESWVHLSTMSGSGNGVLQISVDANPESKKRNAYVWVSVGTIDKSIHIVQDSSIVAPNENDNELPEQK